MARFSTYLVLGAALAGAWLGGCNSVLGIEEPVAKESGSSSTGGSGSGSTVGQTALSTMNAACDHPTVECGKCLAGTCAPQLADCLKVESCRDALSAYRVCLGSKCDPGETDCIEELSFADSPEAVTLSNCLRGQCSGPCKSSSLASVCQMYCGCMALNCPSKVQGQGDCVVTCDAVAFTDIACRLNHCGYILDSKQAGAHCDHAVGEGECPRSSVKNDCADGRRASGWRCTQNAECCSRNCDEDKEICD